MAADDRNSSIHAQTRLGGSGILVDEEIADLIADLREHGVDTVASCQSEGDGLAYVAYRGASSIQAMLRRCVELALTAHDELLAARVVGRARYVPPPPGGRERRIGPPAWYTDVGIVWQPGTTGVPPPEELELLSSTRMAAGDAAKLSRAAATLRCATS